MDGSASTREPDRRGSTGSVENLAKKIVYVIVVLDVIVIFAYYYGYLPAVPVGLLYWGSGLAIIGLIHKVESESHREQRWWWTLLPLAIGGFGLLSWLRHLDRDH